MVTIAIYTMKYSTQIITLLEHMKLKKALNEYGIWDAIEKVQTYEKDTFGEIYTDLSDPERLINMLYYIIGEEVLFEMMDGIEAFSENWNNKADEETNAEILEAIEEVY